MTTYRCLLIEDDPIAQQFLQTYLTRLPYLQVDRVFSNPLDALPYLYTNEIDLLFLDMHLPGMGGLDFLKSLTKPPRVVLITADTTRALDAFDAGVIDYLVKPFTFERLLKAVNRAITSLEPVPSVTTPAYVFLKTGCESVRIPINDILYIEAFGALCKVCTSGAVLVVSELLADLHEQLPEGAFLRVHKSYIAARQHITKISSKAVFIQQHQLPLGATYRGQVETVMGVNR
ncbi:LytTR family DNA-binding domain-containing protein [Nostoc sp. CHAB 5834]|nr:LytTR family DNA-binding domain-containing protein [Nostoc sp. CHAB 5834]